MALKKSTSLESGVTAEYYKIESILLNKDVSSADITLGLYISKDIRDAGKQPLKILGYSFGSGFSVADLNVKNPFEQAYLKLKELSEFSSAEDC